MTLPAPRNAEGRVTLGGRPVHGRNARIRVVAAHKGRGVLDGALGLETTAQADGRFELRGLTPGRYAVQAARDGIWLSRAIELTVGPDKDPVPLALDIPEPGAPVTLQVVDRAGRPVADHPIGLVRPQGPLASLWPSSLRTDPDGTLTLRGLEAGRHTILIGDGKERREIEVPAAGGKARPTVERIVVPDEARRTLLGCHAAEAAMAPSQNDRRLPVRIVIALLLIAPRQRWPTSRPIRDRSGARRSSPGATGQRPASPSTSSTAIQPT